MGLYNNAIWVHGKKDVPDQEHWAIIKFKKVSQPGYDHGDPPYMVDVCEYVAFLERADWEAQIQELEARKYGTEEYVAFKMPKPATIVPNVRISE